MRRLTVLILLFIVPFQLAWSAAMTMHVHLGGDAHAIGAHFHDHDLHAGAHSGHDHAISEHGDDEHDDNHHVSHCHHVYSAILALPELNLRQSQRDAAPVHPAVRFSSHTPFLPDPPPPARA